jgi:hypothetical protein
MKWRFTLTNTHAACAYYAEGKTRRQAFDNACAKAGPAFLTYRVSDVYWLDGFYSCRDRIRNASRVGWSNEARSMHVDLERVP